LKKKGLPWEIAKAFDHSAVISPLIPKEEFLNPQQIEFSLQKNGAEVQRGNTKDVIFDFDSLISYISQRITLRKGDLLYTGTPAGVGSVQIGDKLEGFLQGNSMFVCNIK
jgi:2-keto-4-pentenoate hydratase/2-oxohepta-3-ene-1,7-dioic acid hydratase in catechol pathway